MDGKTLCRIFFLENLNNYSTMMCTGFVQFRESLISPEIFIYFC